MANEESESIKKWVQCWKKAGVELEKFRREQIRQTNTQLAIENLNAVFIQSFQAKLQAIFTLARSA